MLPSDPSASDIALNLSQDLPNKVISSILPINGFWKPLNKTYGLDKVATATLTVSLDLISAKLSFTESKNANIAEAAINGEAKINADVTIDVVGIEVSPKIAVNMPSVTIKLKGTVDPEFKQLVLEPEKCTVHIEITVDFGVFGKWIAYKGDFLVPIELLGFLKDSLTFKLIGPCMTIPIDKLKKSVTVKFQNASITSTEGSAIAMTNTSVTAENE